MELERNLDLDRDLEVEVEDRPGGLTKAGQNKGFNVTCKKWTSRLVTVTPGAVGYLNSSGDMKRCTVQYKVRRCEPGCLMPPCSACRGLHRDHVRLRRLLRAQ